MVDTGKKIISHCGWKSKGNLNWRYYNGQMDFDIVKKILNVKVHFTVSESQQVGGVRISTYGGRGYISGGTTVSYERRGYEVHQFCTKTNKYLGYKESIYMDKEREWIRKTDRY